MLLESKYFNYNHTDNCPLDDQHTTTQTGDIKPADWIKLHALFQVATGNNHHTSLI
ncbi:hypothetical protein GCM10026987_05280 [Belliella aquatica]|uniref:Uncharacterized protein n=1 Tax=Belliella aquatica TaxID=1323734 RepID=A0ABQ1MC20_9BACT|nr:hypothetical protein GCM10010993_16220 [Belliella aquatica]